jgi:TonB family protein
MAAAGLLWAAPAGSAVQGGDGGAPAVSIRTVSDRDDPAAIRPARPLAAETWLLPEDFPQGTFVPGKLRGFELRLLIDAGGRVTDCKNFGPATELATTACALIAERARFVHAIDAKGTPQPSYRVMSVTLYGTAPPANLPPPPAPPPPGFRNTRPVLKDPAVLELPATPDAPSAPAPRVAVAVSEKGRVTSCRILATTGSDGGDAALCRRIGAARFEPARDPEGRKVAAPSLVLTFKVAP